MTTLILAILLGELSARAQGATEVGFLPAAAQVAAGQSTEVAVEIRNVTGLYGFDVLFTFDPSVTEVVDADPAQPGVQVALGLFMDPGFVLINTADNGAGSVHFAMTQLNPSTPKDGAGPLLVVTFKGKQSSAASALTLTKADFSTPQGVEIPVTSVPGRLEVVASAVGPTNTPFPTQGAGTPMVAATGEPTMAVPTAPPAPRATPSPPSPPAPDPRAATATPLPMPTTSAPTPTQPETRMAPSVSPVLTATAEPVAQPSVAVVQTEVLPTDTAAPRASGSTPTPLVIASAGSETSPPSSNTGSPSTLPGRNLLVVGVSLLGVAILLGGAAAVILILRRPRSR